MKEDEDDALFQGGIGQCQPPHDDALAVSADPFLDSNRDKIIGLAPRYSVPTI